MSANTAQAWLLPDVCPCRTDVHIHYMDTHPATIMPAPYISTQLHNHNINTHRHLLCVQVAACERCNNTPTPSNTRNMCMHTQHPKKHPPTTKQRPQHTYLLCVEVAARECCNGVACVGPCHCRDDPLINSTLEGDQSLYQKRREIGAGSCQREPACRQTEGRAQSQPPESQVQSQVSVFNDDQHTQTTCS